MVSGGDKIRRDELSYTVIPLYKNHACQESLSTEDFREILSSISYEF